MGLEEIVTQNCIFVCAQEESPTQQAIDTLLIQNFKHLYFINPPSKISNYLLKITTA